MLNGMNLSYKPEELRHVAPHWERIDLIWENPRIKGSLTERKTRTIDRDIIIIGAASNLLFSDVQFKYSNSDITLSQDYVPIWGLSGGFADSRQPYFWPLPLRIPARTELTIIAKLGEVPASGGNPATPESDGVLILHCIKIGRG